MDDQLKTLLTSNGIHQEVIDWLAGPSIGCVNVKLFANWCSQPDDVQSNILDHVASVKGSRAQNAGLKQAWREAEASVVRVLKRTSEGIAEEDLEGPLSTPVQQSVERTFVKYYKFPVDPTKFGYDGLLGRIQREFVRQQPTMISVMKVRTVATCQKSTPGKRTRLADKLLLVDEQDVTLVGDPSEHRLRFRLFQYRVLCDTWALAGCFVYPDTAKPDDMYCHWVETQAYHGLLTDRANDLLDHYYEDSITNYIIQTEDAIRGYALMAARDRNDPKAWGRSLLEAAHSHAQLWQDNKHLLRILPGHSASAGPSMSPMGKGTRANVGTQKAAQGGGQTGFAQVFPPSQPRATPRPQQSGTTSSGNGLGKGGKGGAQVKTCSETKSGLQICKRFNDVRGCDAQCPHGKVHCCDVAIGNSGSPCEARSHNRVTHDPNRHGMTKPSGK